jgi:hypothetical protein
VALSEAAVVERYEAGLSALMCRTRTGGEVAQERQYRMAEYSSCPVDRVNTNVTGSV